jgi:lipoprotein-releasing system permease protein
VNYALEIGSRYLRSKKRATISVITVIAITGVALGVGALLAVMSVASGFQQEFRDKVLGVNAHVLVLKYGLDFNEYRDVITTTKKIPGVVGAAPFIINEMMLAKGDRLAGVLVKGVDPKATAEVLALPKQIVEGSLAGLRLPGAGPATKHLEADKPIEPAAHQDNLDDFLAKIADGKLDDLNLPSDVNPGEAESASDAPAPHTGIAAGSAADTRQPPELSEAPLPEVAVPSPESVEAALSEGALGQLPNDEQEASLFAAAAPAEQRVKPGSVTGLPGIVVGRTLADELKLKIGDPVKVISPLSGLDTSLWKSGKNAPQARDFRVIAIFEAGFREYDSRLVYVDLYQAQSFYDQGDTVTGVEITLADLDNAGDVATRLESQLGGGPYHTMDWKELNQNLFTALKIQKITLSLVITTIIVVAAFNVIATLIMIVLEKRREIAILKAMGAKDSAIMQIFLVQGAAIGLIGTAIGLLLGGAACFYLTTVPFPLDPKVYLIDHLPLRISAVEFSATVVISLLICISSILIPSWWAARLLPAAGIRYQ